MFKVIIAPLICFLGFIIAHALVFHHLHPQRRFRATVCIMSASVICYALVFWFILKNYRGQPLGGIFSLKSVDALAGLFIYVFFLAFYYQLLVLFDRSVSIRMMIDIDRSGEKGLTLEELKSSYSLEGKFRDEVRDMLFLSRFRQEGDYLYNTPKGSFHARVFDFLRRYLNLATNR